jgi:hypothetical protein
VKHTRVLAAGLFALLASCSDSNDPDNLIASGTVEFSYSGAPGGTYDVTGAVPISQSQAFTTSWAAGARDDDNDVLDVVSVRARGSGLFDDVFISIPRVTPGNVTVSSSCTAEYCAEMAFTIGASTSSAVDFEHFCELESGTLTITSISSTRATGTFSGIGVCFDDQINESNFAVSGGSFDVALTSNTVLLRSSARLR